MKHERRVVGHASGWQEQMNTCVCGEPWPCAGEVETSKQIRHAGRMGDDQSAICGAETGRATRPGEMVNCPDCRTILNHVRQTYPEHAGYGDWRLSERQCEEAARNFVADMHGGTDD